MQQRYETFTVLIDRISRNIRRIKNQEMAQQGLRSAHISCLYYLFVNQGITVTELCERCEEDKATVSRALDYLEKEGYLCCRRAGKGYKSPLQLTDRGLEAGERISAKIHGVLEEVSAVLTEEERISFYRSLAVISESLEEVWKRGDKLSAQPREERK